METRAVAHDPAALREIDNSSLGSTLGEPGGWSGTGEVWAYADRTLLAAKLTLGCKRADCQQAW